MQQEVASTGAQRDAAGILFGVQALRGIAALVVVIGHCWVFAWFADRSWAGLTRKPFDSDAGVDLFFVISGFIMVYAAQRLYGRPGAHAVFFERRLVRVVPLLWIVTAATAIWLYSAGPAPHPLKAVLSFFLIPFSPDDTLEHIVPINDPAWTLSFEMLFYGLFGLSLSASAGRTVAWTTALIAGLIVVGALLPPSPAPPAWLFTWTRPMLVEFVAGMLLGLAWLREVRLPGGLGIVLVAVGLAVLFGPRPEYAHWQGWGRVMSELPGATLAVAGAALGDRHAIERAFGSRPLVMLGDASYSLYLWHMPLLFVLSHLFRRLPFESGALYVGIGLLLSLAAGLASHRWLERPLIALLRRPARATAV